MLAAINHDFKAGGRDDLIERSARWDLFHKNSRFKYEKLGTMVNSAPDHEPLSGADGPSARPTEQLRPAEQVRYARHLTLPQFGLPGQLALRSARILVVGAGGLGSPALQYLAAAGIGHITIIDDDSVDLSNLQRQTIHTMSALGQPKVESAAARLVDLNPEVAITTVQQRLTPNNVVELVEAADVVLDGTDNFDTRYLLNDVCVALSVPYIWAAVFQFDAQLSVFCTEAGPCLRCIFPTPPPPGSVPNCATGGVLGVLPGLVGTAQALEAIKVVSGIGEPLVGNLATLDALSGRWDYVPLAKRPGCICDSPAANPHAEARRVAIRHEQQSAANQQCVIPAPIRELTAAQAFESGPFPGVVLDVRTAEERAAGFITDSLHIPLDEVLTLDMAAAHTRGIDTKGPVLVYCAAGARSLTAAQHLSRLGIAQVASLRGGITAYWQQTSGLQ